MNGVSLKFKFIEQHLGKLFFAIASNKNIAKYVFYKNSNDPLSMPDVTVNMIDEGYYHLNFFDTTVSEDEKIRLFFNVIGSPLNEPVDNVTFLIEVVCPPKYYALKGQGMFRGIRVLDEIAMMVDQQIGIGAGKVKMVNYRESRESRSGYNVSSANIIIKNPTTKGSGQ